MPPLFQGPDGLPRCGWCAASERYMAYHDHDWGYPVDDDRRLFEKLCLEGFQSGLREGVQNTAPVVCDRPRMA
jgi:DNA-3-methyladenine glycosylase I